MEDEMELPQPPTTKGAVVDLPIIEVSSETLDTASDFNEPLPKGIYHFRLEEFRVMSNKDRDWDTEQPQFFLKWVCQEEPNVGRVYTEFLPWVGQDLLDASQNGDGNAQSCLKRRLAAFKALKKGIGFESATINPNEMLQSNPEVKISLSVTEKKTYVDQADGTKKLEGTGEFQNRTQKYLRVGI